MNLLRIQREEKKKPLMVNLITVPVSSICFVEEMNSSEFSDSERQILLENGCGSTQKYSKVYFINETVTVIGDVAKMLENAPQILVD